MYVLIINAMDNASKSIYYGPFKARKNAVRFVNQNLNKFHSKWWAVKKLK